MELTLARQPIFDRRGELHAYELLYRSPNADSTNVSASTATARVLVAACMELGLSTLTGGRRAYVNVDEALLCSGLLDALPASEVTIEVLEDVPATPEVLEAVTRLRELGFQIALDDLVDDVPERRALLPLAHVWKVDVLHGMTPEIATLLERHGTLDRPPILLAEKVESAEVHARLLASGFELFQGYFHGRPEVRRSAALPLAATSVLRLVRRLYAPNADLDSIEAALGADAALVVRLLRLVSSPAWGLKHSVSSVRQAIVLLGIVQIRRWATVLALANLNLARSPELLRRSLVRARLCMGCGDPSRADELFLLGLFSLLDALTGRPLGAWLEELPLSPDARQALVDGAGPHSVPLRIAIALEGAQWDELSELESSWPDAVGRARASVLSAWEEASRAFG